MFSPGDMVVYGGEGVCRVEKVEPATLPGADKSKLYYTLHPLSRTGQVLTPVDTRVLMRPILTPPQAQALLEALEQLGPDELPAGSLRLQKEYYQKVVASYDCVAQARFICGAAQRRRRAAEKGKKPSQMEERYLKRAEEQLYGELAAALDMEKGRVPDHIRTLHPRWPEME